MAIERLPHRINNLEDALGYYKVRAIQLLPAEWTWDGSHRDLGWGLDVIFEHDEESYHSVYVFEEFQGQGLLYNWHDENPEAKIWTLNECNIEPYLVKKSIDYKIAFKIQLPGYKVGMRKVGDNLDPITGDFLMNEIDISMYILDSLGVPDGDREAFALTPAIHDFDVINATFPQRMIVSNSVKAKAKELLEHAPREVTGAFAVAQLYALYNSMANQNQHPNARELIKEGLELSEFADSMVEDFLVNIATKVGSEKSGDKILKDFKEKTQH